jgi:hypothetical protein
MTVPAMLFEPTLTPNSTEQTTFITLAAVPSGIYKETSSRTNMSMSTNTLIFSITTTVTISLTVEAATSFLADDYLHQRSKRYSVIRTHHMGQGIAKMTI